MSAAKAAGRGGNADDDWANTTNWPEELRTESMPPAPGCAPAVLSQTNATEMAAMLFMEDVQPGRRHDLAAGFAGLVSGFASGLLAVVVAGRVSPPAGPAAAESFFAASLYLSLR